MFKEIQLENSWKSYIISSGSKSAWRKTFILLKAISKAGKIAPNLINQICLVPN